ncbi:MAG: YjjG family noncanonical pyrimidine nucleotidase [Clostridia bacterium]|nr:YjjG family noncanonical pyrimidine nucleotidase [Clostridia bacterium]
MKYKAILMDSDETLLNFELAEEKALHILFDHLNMDCDSVSGDYKRINSGCWAAYEKGEMTQKELRIRRFTDFLALHPSAYPANEVADFYENALSMQHDELPGAYEAAKAISASLPIAIVTNGIATIQRPRMENCSLRPFFSEIVISEEVGFSKPRPEMLLIALQKLGSIDVKDALMIGDSLTSDMRAAQNAGIDFLWYNPKGKKRPDDAWITYETDKISDYAKYALMS